MTSFWSLWVIILTTVTIAGITWILFANRKRDAEDLNEEKPHEYDGITEYDNPLPAWWFYMFVITIVWAIGYLIAYPGMGNFPGVLNWTQLDQHKAEVSRADEQFRAMRNRYVAMPIEEIASDPAVRKMGMRIFGNNCAQCHGADAKGTRGFPNLTDDDWIYGGTPEAIKTSISNGRRAAMPAWGSVIGDEGVAQTTAYIISLNGREANEEEALTGQKVYQTYCLACHGYDATGNPILGAPNLTNGIWLYGGSAEQLSVTIGKGRYGVMPAHNEMLSEDKIHILAAYVYGLSQ
ncbi:MAG: cytochrome c oxidase cbb3-type subunit 3 [Halioglobus sp.]|jgi:cytochrome c oxidase cbb3-type subunit 3